MTKLIDKQGWLDEIAVKSKCEIRDVKSVIQKYDIQQSPNTGIPKHLKILEVSFSGTKEGKFLNDFDFSFDNLNSGIYGVLSDINLRGKTTILETIKWLIRGSSSSLFQDGVKGWIKKASLKFKINDIQYQVKLEQCKSEVSGVLLTEKESIIAEFYSNDEFENCMSEFMIKEFSLDRISAFRKGKLKEQVGSKVNHNWASLASALFISTNYSSLFGDVTTDGLSNRLMNMYLGLPWISTHTNLKTVQSQINSENKVEGIHLDKETERKRKRYLEITSELEEIEKKIITIPSDKDVQEVLKKTREDYGSISRNLTQLDTALRSLSEDFRTSKETKLNDIIKVNNFKEDRAANTIFKRLNPVCCPHCDNEITKEKIEKEKTSHQCAICDEPLLVSEDAEVLLNELITNSKSSEKTFNAIDREYKKQKKYHSELSSKLIQFQKDISFRENELSKFSERQQLEKEIMRLQILKEEYTVNDSELKLPKKNDFIDEGLIIKKAIEVTEGRFKVLQEDLLNKVSNEILRISKLVGLGHIESVKLTSNPHLKLEKDGSSTSYSKCSEGEKLRLKVITTIALLSVAEKENVGRHPGVLLIDSPGAQEVADEDLNSLIEGLKQLTKELPFLQIIIASRASDVVLSQIDENHRKHAKGDSYLW
ncbi:hypothetical protein H0I25_10265 [Cellulophaga sp. HaHa_2_95]|uniref:hypothetical protein n=1 Tax=Cellulophaga sp. HaHa_2_95 TaxID=2745558 RepID=UPI001C4E7772|nr:hypothetical protein [Cellulophaga sp. HaHa_2_95]QXP54475.1 hypothetical protein H0I25_10265 [Cellulophaga sp. HaHa_2_95]